MRVEAWRGLGREAASMARRFGVGFAARSVLAAISGLTRGDRRKTVGALAAVVEGLKQASGSCARWGAFSVLLGGGYRALFDLLEPSAKRGVCPHAEGRGDRRVFGDLVGGGAVDGGMVPSVESEGMEKEEGALDTASATGREAGRFCQLCARRRARSAALAGGAAAVSSVLLSESRSVASSNPYITISLHMAVRAVEMVIRDSVRTGVLVAVPFGSTLVFQLSCAVIMTSWFYAPDSLPAVYRKWITTFADMDTSLLAALKGMREGKINYGEHSDILEGYCKRWGVPPAEGDPGNGFLPCSTVHPWDPTSCNGNGLRRLERGFRRAMALYVPVHVVSHVLHTLSHRGVRQRPDKRVQHSACADSHTDTAEPTPRRPRQSVTAATFAWVSRFIRGLPHALFGAVRSSAFLGTFIAVIWRTICAVRNTVRNDLAIGPMLGSSLCGLSVLFERASRRTELACYVAPRALQTIWSLGVKSGFLASLPFSDIGFICFAVACFMYYYEAADRDNQDIVAQQEKERQPQRAIMRPLFRSFIVMYLSL